MPYSDLQREILNKTNVLNVLYHLADRLLQEFVMFSFVDIFYTRSLLNHCMGAKIRKNFRLRSRNKIESKSAPMILLDGRRASTILCSRSGGDAREAMTVGCKPTMILPDHV